MKKHTRRGFTVVELVVVIAVIAVLAAVLIPTFTSIIKKANDSAYLQERQSKQIEDLAAKVDKMNYLSWEDFEAKLAEEIAKINKSESSISKTDIENAVQAAMEQYQASHGTGDTGLSEAQVKKIVETALEGQLTSTQVEAIVRQAIAQNPSTAGLTEAQVRAIVNAAVANIKPTGVSKADVQKAITDALKNNTGLTESQVTTIVNKALSGFSTLTEEQVKTIVEQALAASIPEEDTIYIAGDMTLAAGKTYILRTMNTIPSVTLTVPSGVTVKEIIIDAPNVQTVDIVYENGASALETVQSLKVISTASSSTHVRVNVADMEVNSGRAVLEDGATVDNLTAAPSTNSNVTIVVSNGAEVSELNTEYQNNGFGTNDTIKVINGGSVDNVNLTASNELKETKTTTTNIEITNQASETNIQPSDVNVTNDVQASLADVTVTLDEKEATTTPSSSTLVVIPTEENTTGDSDVAYVSNIDELVAALAAKKTYIVFKNDIENRTSESNTAGKTIDVNYSCVIDGNGYSLIGSFKRGTTTNYPSIGFNISKNPELIDVVLKNLHIKTGKVTFESDGKNQNAGGSTRALETRGNIGSLKLYNVNVETTNGTAYIQPLTIGGNQSSTATIIIEDSVISGGNGMGYGIISFNPINLSVNNSTIVGWSCVYLKGKDGSAGTSGSVVNIYNSVLDSTNKNSGNSDHFGCVVFEDKNINVNLTDCEIYANQAALATQHVALFSAFNSNVSGNCHVNIGGDSTITYGDLVAYGVGALQTSSLTISGGEFTVDPTDYLATGYKAVESGKVWIVKEK